MRSFVYRCLFVLSLMTLGFFHSQATTLGLGDIAFTGYNSDSDDNFSFVLLTDISGTTIISFTDLGWRQTGGFIVADEGTITLTITGSHSCGTQIVLSKSGSTWSSTIGTISETGDMALSTSGDQIFAYNGSAPPGAGNEGAFIMAIDFNDIAGWDSDAIDRLTSARPSIFTDNPGNDFAISQLNAENGSYTCIGNITSGTPAELRTALLTESKWGFSSSSSALYPLPPCSLACVSTCTDPTITSLTTNTTIGSNTFCPGDNVIITINGTANDATSWNLYAGNSCGGAALQTIPVSQNTFMVMATNTTTYSIAGIGGCVANPTACTAITITVNGLTANAGSDQKISGTTTANISGNGSGTWSIVGVGDGNGFFDGVPGTTSSTIATTTFSGTAGQAYELRWTVTNAGCPNSSDEVIITFLSATTLGLGDIAFTGYNSDAPDEFRFVLLKEINAGTQITFTDRGWLSSEGFRGNEQTITYEFCRPYACGDEFSALSSNTHIKDEGGNDAAIFVTGSFPQLSSTGDQVFAYQGSEPTTGGASNWIAAIQMNGAWDSNASDANSSAQPSAFTDGLNSISISPKTDNAEYNCAITTNSPANLGAAVNTASNWNSSSTVIDLNYCSFTCGSCVEPVLTSVSAPSSACPGQTVALTITGTLNGANEWAIYTGSCGGTLVGTTTGSSFNVTPTATTTYYVSGRGGCVVTESCQTATISVTSVQADAGPNDVEKILGNTMTQLQGNGGLGDGTWTLVDPGDGQGMLADDENPTTTFEGTAGQSYTLKWTIDNSAAGCPDTEDEVTIVFLDQTGLTLGDIAFISYSSDEDDFAFVLLKDINAGTTIKFTDRGWLAAGGFRAGEGTITVEFCRPYSCGDEFNVFDSPHEIKDASGRLAGTITGSPLEPSTSGDQIFAYQGPETNLITGIQMNGAWDADATNTNTSAKPSAFTDGVNSISIAPEVDNANLDCSEVTLATGNQINNSANWNTDDNNGANLPLNCSLACCTPGVATSISGSTGPLCPNSLQTLSVVGSLNDDQSWVWYTGSCGGTQVATGTNFNVSPVTTTTYYVRAEGTCSGTSGACASLTIVVEDGVDPVASCPADITVNNDAGFCSAVVNFNATATDNCGGTVDITYSQNPGTTFNVGTTQVDVTATDDLGNTDNCSFDVTVTDNEGPVAICPASIPDVVLDAGGNGTLPANIGDGSSTDNCSVVETSPTASFTCDDVGTQMVTLMAVDATGNTKTVNCSFNVVDKISACNQKPVAECRSISVSADPNSCETTIDEAQIDDGSFDPDAGDIIQLTLDNNGPFPVGGPYMVELTVSDGSLTDKCTAMVTVTDDEAPTFSNCPGDISVSNDLGECGADVEWMPPTLGDNCPVVSSNSSHNPDDFFPVGSTIVTYSGSDAAGNAATNCVFIVTVNDTQAPTFSNCPEPINLFNDQGDCGAIATWTAPVFEDNCPEESFNSTHISGAFFPVGTTTVTYSGSDKAGNPAVACSFTVSVTDMEDPRIDCPADISTGTDPGVCGAQVTFTPAIASDNCAIAEVKARYRPVDENGTALGSWSSRVVDPSGFFPVGRYQVQWRAKDIYGNKESCSHYLDVYDDEDPAAVCKDLTIDFNGQQNISLSLSQVWDEAASSDNCGSVEFVSADLTIGCEELGNTVAIPVTIQDEVGNEDDCTAYVDVIGLPCGWSEGPNDGSLNCDGQTTANYDVDDESFTLTSDGCWHDCRDADKGTYVYHPLCGDGTLTAELASINTSGYAGLMARESLDPLARRAGVLKNVSTRRVRREYRAIYGGIVSQSRSNRSRVKWLRIVRNGNEIKSYTSRDGNYWRILYKVTFSNLDECIYVGMMAYSLNGSAEVEAVFKNVTLSGSGTLAGGIPEDPTSITPEDLQAWSGLGDVQNGTIEVFPNPASDQAQIVLDGFEDVAAQLFVRDAFGKVVRQVDLDSAAGVIMPLEVQDLPPGVYLISLVQSDRLVISKRLVIQK